MVLRGTPFLSRLDDDALLKLWASKPSMPALGKTSFNQRATVSLDAGPCGLLWQINRLSLLFLPLKVLVLTR